MIEYQILVERLPENPPPGEAPNADAWETVMYVPFKKDTPVVEADVIKLKEHVAMLVVFGKTSTRVRVAWQELSRGRIGGKHIMNPREVYFFDDFTFDSAKTFLITRLENVLTRIKDEKHDTPIPDLTTGLNDIFNP